MRKHIQTLLTEALSRYDGSDLYSLAVYWDHESGLVSICIDTEKNSRAKVIESNEYNYRYWSEAIKHGDIEDAKLWQANPGRNLSLGDFAYVNIVESELQGRFNPLEAIGAIESSRTLILQKARSPSDVRFMVSTEQEEVGLVWS